MEGVGERHPTRYVRRNYKPSAQKDKFCGREGMSVVTGVCRATGSNAPVDGSVTLRRRRATLLFVARSPRHVQESAVNGHRAKSRRSAPHRMRQCVAGPFGVHGHSTPTRSWTLRAIRRCVLAHLRVRKDESPALCGDCACLFPVSAVHHDACPRTSPPWPCSPYPSATRRDVRVVESPRN